MDILKQAEYRDLLAKMRDPQHRSWILLNPSSMGETGMVCAFAHAFVQQHGHPITMVVQPNHVPITQMYPNRFLRVLTADQGPQLKIAGDFLDPNRFELDTPICMHHHFHGSCRIDELQYLFKYPGRGGISHTDTFRHLLRLPWDAPLERPTIPQAWENEARAFAEQVGVVPGKSVLLLPKNTTDIGQLSDVMWTALVERLNERGYKVFCNMKGGIYQPTTMPIKGSIPIELPVHLVIPFVEQAGRLISSPNGMQLLLTLCGRFDKVTIVFPVFGSFDDYEMYGRRYAPQSPMHQYTGPEICTGVNFSEFGVPRAASNDEFIRIGRAVADDDRNDFNCAHRAGHNGGLFTEENADWLTGLVKPFGG